MIGLGAATAVVQVTGVLLGAPLVVGAMRQTRARLEGRAGAGVLQPWRDLVKLLGKQQVRPEGTTVVFTAAPLIVGATALVAAAVVPLASVASSIAGSIDLFGVVGLLFLGTVALSLAGLDTGTAFGGMGASRGLTVAALVEPTILVAGFAFSIPVGSTNLAAIVDGNAAVPARAVSPSALLAVTALALAILAETGRLPVDNPSTHLELTMIHEAMVLEYAGPRLALVEWGSGIRMLVLLGLLVNLLAPWGIGSAPGGFGGALGLALGALVVAAKVLLVAVGLAAAEVVMAKVRLFRVPELLAGSFLLALVAVITSSFWAG